MDANERGYRDLLRWTRDSKRDIFEIIPPVAGMEVDMQPAILADRIEDLARGRST